jgi:chemotaxis response regulator CheB
MNDRNNIKYKVMLVDDSSLVRGYLQKLLQIDPQIEVCATAENGQIAIEKVKESNPDIILLDIEMPVMNGITAIPLLLNEKPDVKIIMVSTLTSNNAAKSIEAMSKGATDYIEKPSANTDKEQFKNILIEKIKAIARPTIIREVKKFDSDDEFNFLKPEGRLKLPEPLTNTKAEHKNDGNSLTIINDASQEKKLNESIEKSLSGKKKLKDLFLRLLQSVAQQEAHKYYKRFLVKLKVL